jgi:hypothetical protein
MKTMPKSILNIAKNALNNYQIRVTYIVHAYIGTPG